MLLLIYSTSYAQLKVKVYDRDITQKPVNSTLYGSFYELGFGRSDLMWGELLFNRDFELVRPLGEKISWVSYSRPKKEQEDWWHSGYEEPRWYIESKGEKNYDIPKYHNNYWPTGHGKYFVTLDNKFNEKMFLAQDRIYLKKGQRYNVSGLFSNGNQLSAEKYSKEAIPVSIVVCKEGQLNNPIAKMPININTNQLSMYHTEFTTTDFEGWCTFAIEIPGKSKCVTDLLSMTSADDICGWKREAVEMIQKTIKPKSMRFPGGCFASLYDWRSGVGPRVDRPVTYDAWWGNEIVNDVGTIEFVDFCQAIDSEPFFCVPVMFSDAYNAAEWVDFCNNPNNERRKGYGRDKPLNVKYWEMDNEPYRRLDAISYAKKCAEFAKEMKKKDPTIKIAMGNYWIFNPKFSEMLDIAGPYVDLITNRGGEQQEMLNDLKILEKYNKEHHTSIILCHTEFRAPLSRSEKGPDGLNLSDNNEKETMFNRSVRWEYAMSMVNKYIEFQNMGGDFYTANFTNLTDGWGEGLINIAKDKIYLSSAGVAFSLLSKLDVSHPQYIENENNNIVMQAAWNKKKDKLTLIILNFGKNGTKCVVDLSNFKRTFAKSTVGYVIAPESRLSFNSPSDTDKVKTETIKTKAGKKLSLDLKSHSMNVYELTTN